MALLEEDWAQDLTKEIEQRAQKLGISVKWTEDRGEGVAHLDHIVAPRIRYDIDYLIALHEIGHHILDSQMAVDFDEPVYDEFTETEEEAQIWRWAMDNSTISITPEMLRQAQWDLGTYHQLAVDTFQGVREDWKNPNYQWMLQQTADYQGMTNWETWNTKLMLDNERETYDASRELVKKFQGRPEDGVRSLENWIIQVIIAPYNKQQIEDAQEWNDIPEHDRLDYNYENLKEKNEQAADLVNQFGFGPDVSDTEPQIIDPNLVNWHEIFQSIEEENEENRRYEEGLPATWEEPKADPDKPGDFTLPQNWGFVQ